MGVVSLIFNFYLIIAMTKSAFDVLEKVPHRFIYRILVTTIAIGKHSSYIIFIKY